MFPSKQIFQRIAELMDLLVDKFRLYELHPATLMLRESQREAAEYVKQHMPNTMMFRTQRDIALHALSKRSIEGLVLEFGVAGGASIRGIARVHSGTVHGFDSFQGLPEDWTGRHEARGAYSLAGLLPEVPDNVRLHAGWFNDTLPGFLKENPGLVSFLHIDCDLYSSTKTVLTLLAERIVPGTVILFDEYFNYLSWRENEFKAFQEFVHSRALHYKYIAWAYQQVAIVIV